jgi:hypothetical protein
MIAGSTAAFRYQHKPAESGVAVLFEAGGDGRGQVGQLGLAWPWRTCHQHHDLAPPCANGPAGLASHRGPGAGPGDGPPAQDARSAAAIGLGAKRPTVGPYAGTIAAQMAEGAQHVPAAICRKIRECGHRRPGRCWPGSVSGRCGASDGEVPAATREIQRPKSQKEGCPSVDAVREAHDARGGRHSATGNIPDPIEAEVAVCPWGNQAVNAGSRGRCPRPARAFPKVGKGRVVEYLAESGSECGLRCVHRDASCRLRRLPPRWPVSALRHRFAGLPGQRQGSFRPSSRGAMGGVESPTPPRGRVAPGQAGCARPGPG